MKKAIVTGATGFIGRFLVRELNRQNVETISIVRSGSKNMDPLKDMHSRIIECDIRDYHTLADKIPDRDIDAVFHAAWQGVSGVSSQDEDIQLQNVKSTLELIDVCHEIGGRTFVGCGSIHEAEGLVEMSADRIATNLGLMYKSAKTAAHWMGKAKCGHYGIRFFWPLIINAYGEEEKSPRLINTMIRKVFAGESPALSAGYQYYDFVHVSDVAHVLYLIAEKGINGTNYIIGSGHAKPLKEFLKVVGKVANELNGNTNIPLGFGQVTGDVISLPLETFDAMKLKNDTGFEISIPFEEGVRKTAEWIKNNWLHSNVEPKLEFGKPNQDQEPLRDRELYARLVEYGDEKDMNKVNINLKIGGGNTLNMVCFLRSYKTEMWEAA